MSEAKNAEEELAKVISISLNGPKARGSASMHDCLVAAHFLISEGYAKRSETLEEAAKVCEQEAQDFLSPEYAAAQPLSSTNERFACKHCAEAIRQLKGQP